MSNNKRAINWPLVIKGLALQFFLGFMALRTSYGKSILQAVADVVGRLYQFADSGSAFLFGNLVNPQSPWGFIFAVKVLPIIIFFGASDVITLLFGEWYSVLFSL